MAGRPDGGEEAYRPDLSDAAFVARLERGFRETLPPWDDAGAFKTALLNHFDRRETPRFFLQPSDVAAAIDRITQQYPQWREAVVARVQVDLTQGVPLYDRLGPPAERLFDGPAAPSLEEAAGVDTLYRYKALRMAFLPRLCLACCHGAVPAGTIETVLRGFIGACAREELRYGYPTDLVVTQRAIALSWSLVFLLSLRAGGDKAVEAAAWLALKILLSDIDFLSSRIGQSVANNHLLVDGFAGWYLGSLFPEAEAAAAFGERGEEIWLAELERQIYGDGGSFEHCTHYHEMACELAVAYRLLKRRNDAELPAGFEDKLRSMLSLQAALSGPEAEPLPLGDATEDPMFPLDAAESWATGAMRAALNALYPGSAEAPREDCPSLQRAFWLFGGALPAAVDAGEEPGFCAFPEAGLYVINDKELSARLVFRSGLAPGARHWAGHMHADFLSVYLSVEGQPLIVDAGTYSYRYARKAGDAGETSWRAYFMGPQAHNTLNLSGCDPLGPCPGDFRPRETAASVSTTLQRQEDGITWLEGELQGVPQLEGYRRGFIHIPGAYALLYDRFDGPLPSEPCTLSFQCAENTAVDQEQQSLHLASGSQGAVLYLDRQLAVESVLEGSLAPLGGWLSPAYGVLQPAPQIRLSWQPRDRVTALSIAVGGQDDRRQPIGVFASQLSERRILIEARYGAFLDYFLITMSPEATAPDLHWFRQSEGDLHLMFSNDGQEPAVGGEADMQALILRLSEARKAEGELGRGLHNRNI